MSSLVHKQNIRHKGEVFEYQVWRSGRKTLALTVTPAMELIVRSPFEKSLEEIENFLMRKIQWVRKQLAFFGTQEPAQVERRYISGEAHYYLGRQYMLEVAESHREYVSVSRERIMLYRRSENSRDLMGAKQLFLKWQSEMVAKHLNERYRAMSRLFDYKDIPTMEIKAMEKRWGSYRVKTKSIALNAKLIHAPLDAIDYVIVHELCHHEHHDHGKEFYKLLSRKMPNWQVEKKKLERYGALVCG